MGRAVPYATDVQGQVITPQEAIPGGVYSCLECQEPVSFRRAHTRLGRDVEAHFSHRPGNECKGESVVHLAAKFRLREALERQEHPFVFRQICTRWHCSETRDVPLTLPPLDTAAEEVPLGTYRLDVGTLLAGQVSMGFEVFHSHRIGSTKAASLHVPWVELQAAATAENPYVLQPVIQERLNADASWAMRYRFAERQDDLPDELETWIVRAPALHITPKGSRLNSDDVEHIFNARQQQSSILKDWLCPRCAEARQSYLNLLQEQQEQARRADELELERQRSIFGPTLQRPFSPYEAEEMERKASTIRFALRYMPYPERLLAYFRQQPYETLIARRCAKCNKPILCVDSTIFLANYKVYYPMFEFFKPDPEQRSYLIPKCLHCGAWQKLRNIRTGKFVSLRGELLVRWADAFKP